MKLSRKPQVIDPVIAQLFIKGKIKNSYERNEIINNLYSGFIMLAREDSDTIQKSLVRLETLWIAEAVTASQIDPIIKNLIEYRTSHKISSTDLAEFHIQLTQNFLKNNLYSLAVGSIHAATKLSPWRTEPVDTDYLNIYINALDNEIKSQIHSDDFQNILTNIAGQYTGLGIHINNVPFKLWLELNMNET